MKTHKFIIIFLFVTSISYSQINDKYTSIDKVMDAIYESFKNSDNSYLKQIMFQEQDIYLLKKMEKRNFYYIKNEKDKDFINMDNDIEILLYRQKSITDSYQKIIKQISENNIRISTIKLESFNFFRTYRKNNFVYHLIDFSFFNKPSASAFFSRIRFKIVSTEKGYKILHDYKGAAFKLLYTNKSISEHFDYKD